MPLLGITPESARAVKEIAQFKLDYTFWMNVAAVGLVGWLAWLNHSWHRHNQEKAMDMGGGWIKKTLAWTALAIVAAGIGVHLYLLINPPA